MNPNYTDIFGRLDQHNKKIKNISHRVTTIEQNTARPAVDTTVGVGNKFTVDFNSVGSKVTFTKTDGGSEVDVIIPEELELTRGNQGGLYNAAYQTHWECCTPSYTEWNSIYNDITNYGWHNLSAAADRTYSDWLTAVDGNAGMRIVGLEMLLRHTPSGRIWMIKFTQWTNGINEVGQGGGFSYDRYEILAPVAVSRDDQDDNWVDIIEPGKTILKRDSHPAGPPTCHGGGIYNSAVETYYNRCVYTAPANTEWNSIFTDDQKSGFNDLSDVVSRKYGTWNDALAGNVASNILSTELVMHDLSTDLYWKFQFTSWTPNSNGGGLAYIRTLIPVDQGIKFADGTFMNTAATSSGPVIDTEGNLIAADNSNNTVNVAYDDVHSIPNFSGMLLVNDHYSGRVEVWIAGSGDTVLLNYTAQSSGVPTNVLQMNGSAYEWINKDHLNGPFTFTVIKTRSGS